MNQRKQKIVFVISGVDYALGFDWLDQFLDRSLYEPVFVFLNATRPALADILEKRGTTVKYFKLQSKKDYPILLIWIINLFRRYRPDIVHAHLLDANLLAIPAALICGIKKRVYTRHHSTYHFDYHPHMVKYDKLINRLSTHVVSISQNVSDVLIKMENVPPDKVHLVNHGFLLEKFLSPDQVSVKALHAAYNPQNKRPVIGVISRLTEWKGVHFIIPAFKRLLSDYPDALIIIANAKGDYEAEIKKMLGSLRQDQYRLIPFEKDLFSLYSLFDVFVHVPIDEAAEAFGQVYIEALAAKVPSVFTLSGISREFVVDGENGLVVPFKDAESVYFAMKRILDDSNLREKLIKGGVESVIRKFTVMSMMQALYKVYED
jgi:glycosyltransferase involved in cell wall biosynthesis